MCRTIPNWSEPDTDIVRTKYTKNPGSGFETGASYWYKCMHQNKQKKSQAVGGEVSCQQNT